MGKTVYGPGGGAMPTRPDDKMASENFTFVYPGYEADEKHKRTLRRMLKQRMKKVRRQRDTITLLEHE